MNSHKAMKKKKRKNFMEGMGGELPLRNVSGGNNPEAHVPEDLDLAGFETELSRLKGLSEEELANEVMKDTTPEDRRIIAAMTELAMADVTPEEYHAFYDMMQIMGEAMGVGPSKKEEPRHRVSARKPAHKPMKDASGRTLVLKIQMKDVHKPPMWREVEVPADADFLDLHHVVQTVMGFEDYHLWQFHRPGDREMSISETLDDDDMYMDFGIEKKEPSETPLTEYLAAKGDVMEYEYDYGDSWEFTVQVKDVREKKTEFPVCTKFKCEVNPLEDSGGIWGYEVNRENLAQWDGLTKKERKERASEQCFDSPDEYYSYLKSSLFDIDAVNRRLKSFWQG